MKISEVEAFAIRYPLSEPISDATHDFVLHELAVVRVHTDDGLVGHGPSQRMSVIGEPSSVRGSD